MIITKFETWWVERGRCLFDEKRQRHQTDHRHRH